jgi:hypothetical protein
MIGWVVIGMIFPPLGETSRRSHSQHMKNCSIGSSLRNLSSKRSPGLYEARLGITNNGVSGQFCTRTYRGFVLSVSFLM